MSFEFHSIIFICFSFLMIPLESRKNDSNILEFVIRSQKYLLQETFVKSTFFNLKTYRVTVCTIISFKPLIRFMNEKVEYYVVSSKFDVLNILVFNLDRTYYI